MPKVDADPGSRDVADAGRGAGSPPNVESKNVKPVESTVVDDIPPVHVLEAAQEQERKETEELLSGFDRPGRSPKPVSKERDFVDYYTKKKGAGAESGSGHAKSGAPPLAAPPHTKQSDFSTVLVPRKREGAPGWLAWVGVVALMLVIGGFVAYLATSDGAPKATSTAPSAAATITAALSPSEAANGANNLIPPPEPVDPVDPVDPATAPSAVNAASAGGASGSAARAGAAAGAGNASATQQAPRGAAKRERRDAPAGAGPETTPHGTNATGSKPPPRDDFIRDL